MILSANISTLLTPTVLWNANGAASNSAILKCIVTAANDIAGGVTKTSNTKGLTQDMTIKLKPCPFCGSYQFLPTPPSKYSRFGFVGCKICGTDGPNRLTLDEAKEAWNERAYEKDENDD